MSNFSYTVTWTLAEALSDLFYELGDNGFHRDDVNWKMVKAVQDYKDTLSESEWISEVETAGRTIFLGENSGYGQEDYESFVSVITENI